MGIIELSSVYIGYKKNIILENVNFTISNNDFIAIVGPNGSGKTTLLRAILKKLKPIKGEVSYLEKLTFGYVPQISTVEEFFPFTTYEVVLMGLFNKLNFLGKEEAKQKVLGVLDYFNIADVKDKIFRELSDGNKRKALLARALVSEPKVLVLDEPTANLDISSEKATMDLIKKVYDDKKVTVIVVSHQIKTVINHAKKVLIIKDKKVKLYNSKELNEQQIQNFFQVNA